MAKKYYSLNNLDKIDAQYKILLGEKSNGKSYAVKSRLIEDAYKHNKKFVYIRRYREDLKTNDIAAYFGDAPVKDITRRSYDKIVVDRSYIYLANYDEEKDKYEKGPVIGRAVYLTGYEHFASQTFFPECDSLNLVFEEFITQRLYLDNEPGQLQKMVSTIIRDRPGVVYMVGNTINRVCAYFTDWGLRNTLKQKQGTIDVYTFNRETGDGELVETKIAVEMCESSNSTSNMFFGKTANFITGGEWETYDKAKLPKPVNEYIVLYELLLEDNGFSFVLQLLVEEETGGQFVYVYPFTGKRNIYRKITNKFSTNPLITSSFSAKIKAEVKMSELIKFGKICYSDNLTGSDFEQVLIQRKGAL